MSKYSLLKNLDSNEAVKPQGPGIKYQQYIIPVNEAEIGILIPLRECDNFEASLEQFEELTTKDLKALLRRHRGIRSLDE